MSATHAATVGQMDDDQLFYLRSRGLDRRAAIAILTRAFAAAALERIGDATARARVLERALAPLRGVIGPEAGR